MLDLEVKSAAPGSCRVPRAGVAQRRERGVGANSVGEDNEVGRISQVAAKRPLASWGAKRGDPGERRTPPPRAPLDRHVASRLAMMMRTAFEEAATARESRCNVLIRLDFGLGKRARLSNRLRRHRERSVAIQKNEGRPPRATGSPRRFADGGDGLQGGCERPEISLQHFENARFGLGRRARLSNRLRRHREQSVAIQENDRCPARFWIATSLRCSR